MELSTYAKLEDYKYSKLNFTFIEKVEQNLLHEVKELLRDHRSKILPEVLNDVLYCTVFLDQFKISKALIKAGAVLIPKKDDDIVQDLINLGRMDILIEIKIHNPEFEVLYDESKLEKFKIKQLNKNFLDCVDNGLTEKVKKILLINKNNISQKTLDDSLIEAILQENKTLVQILLKAGAKPNANNGDPMFYAKSLDGCDATILIDYGAGEPLEVDMDTDSN